MHDDYQHDLFSPLSDIDLSRILIADLHDDLSGRIARFRQLVDLSASMGSHGAILAGGETANAHWSEARSSFVNGNYAATVLLAQGLAEHLLAAYLEIGYLGEELPKRVSFHDTLLRCRSRGIISEIDEADLRRLMNLRNPLSHYRSISDPTNLSRRAIDTSRLATDHLQQDATFAISMAVRLLSLPAFRIGD